MIRMLAALALATGAPAIAADPQTAIDTKALDKSIVATLREIHDRGADLYNLSKDYSATYRLYEGSLLTVRPLLAHRPQVQKTIGDGLAAAAKAIEPAQKAFLLHEVIEKTRAELKGVSPMPKPTVGTKPKNTVAKDTDPAPKATEAATISGKVTVSGKPLAEGTVTFVSLDLKAPKVASAAVKDGSYSQKDLPVGKYAVAVTSKAAGAVPAKFATTDTSGLTYQAQKGANLFDIALK
jgi:hypothetical protein